MSTTPSALKAVLEQNHLLTTMNRREALTRMAWLIGGMAIGPHLLLGANGVPGKKLVADFSEDDRKLLDEIGETIVPTTDTPGAKAAAIGAFMITIVTECFDDRHHAVFKQGLLSVNTASKQRQGKSFLEPTPEERVALFSALDQEQRLYRANKVKSDPEHYFSLMKELTILGYFTSEIGCTKALRYVEAPGSYQGEVPYKKGDKAWFNFPTRLSSQF